MGESAARKARRTRQQQERARQAVAVSKPVPAAPPRPAYEEPEEINFLVTPGGLLQPEGAPPMAEKPKTVRVPGPMNVHLLGFQARHGAKRFSFVKVALAMWRMLMREEHDALEAARRERVATGVPVQPRMGPIFHAVVDELELIRREESGEIFDEE